MAYEQICKKCKYYSEHSLYSTDHRCTAGVKPGFKLYDGDSCGYTDRQLGLLKTRRLYKICFEETMPRSEYEELCRQIKEEIGE